MAGIKIRLPLRKRLDEVTRRLSAASKNAGVGAVELPNELFDEMADVMEELADKVFGKTVVKP